MARIWVKGYTKADGSKVEGHYRQSYRRTAASAARTEIKRKNLSFPSGTTRMMGYDGKVVLAKYKTATYYAGIDDRLRKSGADKLIARYSRMQRSKAMRKIYK